MSRLLLFCAAGLLGKRVDSPDIAAQLGLQRATLSESARIRSHSVFGGDVLFSGGRAMEVVACVSDGNSIFLLVNELGRDCLVSGYGVKWCRLGSLSLFDVAAVYFCASYWTFLTPDEILTILFPDA